MPKPIYALSCGNRLFLLSQKAFKQKLKPPLRALILLNMGFTVVHPNSQIEIFSVWPHEPGYGVFQQHLGQAFAVEL